MNNFKNLILAAHIDDEILGCSSILNENTFVLYVTGTPERFNSFKGIYDSCVNRDCLYYKEGELNTINTFLLKDNISKKLSDLKVENIYTHFPDDLHTDHRIVNECALTLFRPSRKDIKSINFFYTTSFENKPNYFKITNNKDQLINLALKTGYLHKRDAERILDYNKFITKDNSPNDILLEPFYCYYRID